jgi:signal transduction histidine kinase
MPKTPSWIAAFGAWSLWAAISVLAIGTLTVAVLVPGLPPAPNLLFPAAVIVVWASVGGLISSRQPANAVGWMMLAIGLAFVFEEAAIAYAALDGGRLPEAAAIAGIGSSGVPVGVTLSVTFLPLLFPDGRLPSHRWRLPALAVALVVVSALLARAFTGDASQVTRAMVFGVGLAVVASIGSLAWRYLRDAGESRKQMQWLFYALAVNAVVFVIVIPGTLVLRLPLDPRIGAVMSQLGAMLIAIAIGAGVLKYRLYDIDLVINRTVVYGLATLLVAAAYFALATTASALIAQRFSVGVSVVAAVLVAAVFSPLRERLQQTVDSIMYGDRHRPATTITRLGGHMARTDAAGGLLPGLAETIASSLRVPHLGIEVRREGVVAMNAVFGSANGVEPARVPLRFRGEEIGQLWLSPRRGEKLSRADLNMLADLAPHVALACKSLQLMDELQASRTELVTAREEERRKLRRDLHDGLGPTLAAVLLQLEVAGEAAHADPSALGALIAELRLQVQTTIGEVRRMAYELRPPALDELGLVSAVRQRAAQFSGPLATRLNVSVESNGEFDRLPAAVEVAAYRIATEALTNVAKHAQARTCVIRLGSISGEVEVDVADDGTGLASSSQPGVGIASMKERVEELGGSFSIGPGLHGGTRVVARLPLAAV